jgi:UDP-GlcNAc:undecaprenyl-phosphate GlcNAc-1-phosphate transferase
LRRGLSVPRVLLLISACSLVTSGGVLASQAFDNELIVLATVVSVVATLIRMRLFGHAEVMLVKERLLNLLQAGPSRQMEVRLQGSADWGQLWLLLTGAAERLNLRQMSLDVNAPALHEAYHARWDSAAEGDEAPTQWRVTIPLAARGQSIGRLEIGGTPDGAPVWAKVAALTQVVDAYTDAPATVDTGRSVPERAAEVGT